MNDNSERRDAYIEPQEAKRAARIDVKCKEILNAPQRKLLSLERQMFLNLRIHGALKRKQTYQGFCNSSDRTIPFDT